MMMFNRSLLLFALFLLIARSEGILRRCFICRSRGDLGTCKDPFTLNSTQAEASHGVEASPCASGWCGKMLEGGNTYKDDDYGIATQRMCLQRAPSDNEERCAYTTWNYKKVFICFCLGDLCNNTNKLMNNNILMFSMAMMTFVYRIVF